MQASKKTLALKGKIPPSALAVRRSLHEALLQDHKEAKIKRLRADVERHREIIATLSKRFPEAFDMKERRPLAIGIHEHILQALGDAIDPKHLQRALRYYTQGLSYLRNMVAGAKRIDLQGRSAGEVTAEEAQAAEQELKRLEARLASRERLSKPKPRPRRLANAR